MTRLLRYLQWRLSYFSLDRLRTAAWRRRQRDQRQRNRTKNLRQVCDTLGDKYGMPRLISTPNTPNE